MSFELVVVLSNIVNPYSSSILFKEYIKIEMLVKQTKMLIYKYKKIVSWNVNTHYKNPTISTFLLTHNILLF